MGLICMGLICMGLLATPGHSSIAGFPLPSDDFGQSMLMGDSPGALVSSSSCESLLLVLEGGQSLSSLQTSVRYSVGFLLSDCTTLTHAQPYFDGRPGISEATSGPQPS